MTKPTLDPKSQRTFVGKIPQTALAHHGQSLFGPMAEWQKRKQPPPVLLLTGQSGIGKRSLAYFLAQWILCEKSGLSSDESPNSTHSNRTPCNECSSCKKTLAGNRVDLTEITSDSEDEGQNAGSLKIDQFRKLKASSGFAGHESRFRLILIPDADRMTIQASNSVLKLFEDTPPGWIFILTATDSTLLLPTLVSRCQVLRLKPYSSAEIQELLKQDVLDPTQRKICADLAQGSWTRALSFSEPEIWEKRQLFFQFLKDPASAVQALIDWSFQEPSNLKILMDVLEQLSADLIRWTTSSQEYSWNNADGKEALLFHAKEVVRLKGGLHSARLFWIERAEQLAQARQDLLAPVNRKLLIQNLLLPWIGAMR